MSRRPRTLPRQRRNQRGAVEDRWYKRVKDANGNTIEVPSAVAGKVTRWRARYVDDVGREHTRAFDRKVDAQKWIDKQVSALLRGDHVAPRDATLTVGEWCDKWLAGYGTRRKSTVRQAEVHLKREHVATTKQVWALYDAVPEGVRPAILFGAHAGLRLAEAAAIRVEDVDFATGAVSPMLQWLEEPLKSDASRTRIPVPKEMAHLLAEAIQLGDGRFLASDQWGNPAGPWTIERAIRACRETAGLTTDFRFHDLRHYFASLLIASGLDVKVVQARLRHASAKTTLDTYGHLWPDRDESSRTAVAAGYRERTPGGA